MGKLRICYSILACFILLTRTSAQAQQPATGDRSIPVLKGEKWFGGAVSEAHLMPFADGYDINLNGDNKGNQASPFFISTAGRYLWSDLAFDFSIKNGQVLISNSHAAVTLGTAGDNLQSAYKAASVKYFPASGTMPDSLLILKPQYNTWIELIYNQQQDSIMKYAHAIVDNGFPAGVLMIDDNWFSYYGNFEFRKDRFNDAREMIDQLHRMGFKVMVWVSPFISPDTETFRDAMAKRLLIYDNKGVNTLQWAQAKDPLLTKWWNGYSAQVDLSNPKAVEWFQGKLQFMVDTYGVDGFKFDAGDMDFYPANMVTYKKTDANEMCELWGAFGLKYPLNEYRAMWKKGGQPLAERLRDKQHTWEDLQKLIPGVTTAGIMGYAFVCPDMIGGGDFVSFINKQKLDQDLVVRSAQCQALMPMMQFSAAPWRVLDAAHLDAVKKTVKLREQLTPYIYSLAQSAAKSGIPVVRSMEYAYPHKGYEDLKDQFMLGDKYLVAPVLTKAPVKKIYFPEGSWRGADGKVIKGPVVKEIAADINSLPYFELIKK